MYYKTQNCTFYVKSKTVIQKPWKLNAGYKTVPTFTLLYANFLKSCKQVKYVI